MTVDSCAAFGFTAEGFGGYYGGITNSILTDCDDSITNFILDHTVVASSGTGIYQTVGAGGYYLADGSTNHNAGTTNIDPDLLADLQAKTTYPPIVCSNVTITYDLTLFPQAQRDNNGSTVDLGYHYDPLDYALGGVTVSGANLTALPGTAVASFGLGPQTYGLMPDNGATVSFEGTATAPDYFVIYNVVQEQTGTAWQNSNYWNGFTTPGNWTTPSSANFGFTIWSALSGEPLQVYADDSLSSGMSALGFHDCQFYSGTVLTYAPAMQVTNCLFHRVSTTVCDLDASLPMTNVFFNNLFVGGNFYIQHDWSNPGEETGWTFEDNLFDQTVVYQDIEVPPDVCNYNGYVTNCSTLTTPIGSNDVILTSSPAYETGTLGEYYYPTNLPLIHAGSRSAPAAGLYHYTVTTNNVIEGTNTVSIGFHYVACGTNGLPLDTNGAGIPDYLEDAYGNGLADSNDPALTTPSFVLIPSVTNGDASLTVNFTINASGLPGTVQSVVWDWEGYGNTDLTTSDLSGQSHTYYPGTYYPVVTVTTSQGTYSSGGGVNACQNNMFANRVTIVVNYMPMIVWSVKVSDPMAIKANADGSVYVLSATHPTLFLYGSNSLYNSSGQILRALDLTQIGVSGPDGGIGFDADSNGNVYTAIPFFHQVMKWNPDGGTGYTLDTTFNGTGYIGNADKTAGNRNSSFEWPIDVAVSPDGTAIYVADDDNVVYPIESPSSPPIGWTSFSRIQKFTSSGSFVLSIGGFGEIHGMKGDATGRLLVTDQDQGKVFSIIGDSVADSFESYGWVASGDSMVIYVANHCFYPNTSSVDLYDSYSYSYIRSLPSYIVLSNLTYVSAWPSQTEQRVYVADAGNNRVIGVTFTRANPISSWNGMMVAVANNNLPQALSYFSQFSSARYSAELQAVGLANVSATLNQLPTPTPTEITDDFAHYTVKSQINEVPITFYINFVNENGVWKISSF